MTGKILRLRATSSPGDYIGSVAKRAQATAIESNCEVEFNFNDILCVVDASTNLEYLLRDYNNAHLMEWKQIGPDCLAEYPIDVMADMILKQVARKARRDAETAKSNAKAAASQQAYEAKTKGIVFALTNPALWRKGVEANPDPYGACVYEFAEGWAKLMQAEMAQGKSLRECASHTSFELSHLGISGFQYGAALGVLSECWAHGEELLAWHKEKR